ncbi:MAG: 2Fe-2S iron-sulfur cluster-binding protein [Spirochaetes bacterium]|nr:2Fe-2S iron-sulfur cluster-binding protein [Spirochaetota bacterium]
MTVSFILNGEDVSAEAEAGERLSSLLSSRFGLRGARGDCLSGLCGRCIVLLGGKPVNSCLVPAFRVQGAEIVTIEGFGRTDDYRDIMAGFRKAGFEPCGFCDSARVLVASAIMEEDPRPDDSLIVERMSAISCRCTQPSALIAGVRAAAEIRERRVFGHAGA